MSWTRAHGLPCGVSSGVTGVFGHLSASSKHAGAVTEVLTLEIESVGRAPTGWPSLLLAAGKMLKCWPAVLSFSDEEMH